MLYVRMLSKNAVFPLINIVKQNDFSTLFSDFLIGQSLFSVIVNANNV